MSTQFNSFLKKHRNISHFGALGTLSKNRVAKKRNQILVDIVRYMMNFSSLSLFFGGYTLHTTTYLLNLVSFKSVPLTPTKMWRGLKHNLQHIHI